MKKDLWKELPQSYGDAQKPILANTPKFSRRLSILFPFSIETSVFVLNSFLRSLLVPTPTKKGAIESPLPGCVVLWECEE